MVTASVQGVFNLLILGFGLTGPFRTSYSEGSVPFELDAPVIKPPAAIPTMTPVTGTISTSSSVKMELAPRAVLSLLRGLFALGMAANTSRKDIENGKIDIAKVLLLSAKFLQREFSGYLTRETDPRFQDPQQDTSSARGFYGLGDTLALSLSSFSRLEPPGDTALLQLLSAHIQNSLVEHPKHSVFAKNTSQDILAGRTPPDFKKSKNGPLVGFLASASHWSFWRDWYQGILDGKPLDWELQRRVALIPDEDWEKGPDHIAEEIEEIKAAWLAEKSPLAEKIEFNNETQKFHAIPIEVAKPDLLGATLSQIEDALGDVLANPSNGLHEGSREVRVLRRVFSKYGNDPQQIEMGLVTVHKGITRQFLSKVIPQCEENIALQDALADGARGIRATHPEVAENRKILNDQALREMSQEDLALLEDAKPLLVALSEGQMAEDWAEDIPQLINDATLPVPSGAPPLPGADEATRIFSRAAKMKLSYDGLVSKGAETFDSKTVKTVRLGLTFGGILSALVGMGLRLFGLI